MANPTNTVLTIPEPGVARIVEKPYPTVVEGFVLVENAIAPVCNEARIFRDHQFEWHDSPEHLGHESVGTVVETRPGSRFNIGDRVIVFQGNSCQTCFVCSDGLSPTHCLGIPYEGFDDGLAPQDVTAGLLGIEKVNGSASGGFAMARYRLAPEHMVMKLPDGMAFEHAAAGNCTLGPSHTMAETVGVTAGDVVLVGGIGFIGLGAVVNALYRGAKVLVLGRNEARMQICRDLGVHAIINPDDPDWISQVHAHTTDRFGADHAFECSGAPFYLDRCFAGVRRYGTVVSLGHNGSQPYSLSILNDMMDRVITWTGGHDVRFRDRSSLLRMLQDPETQRRIDRLVTHTFPMSQAQEAFEVGLSQECGKIYLRPGE
ncbi:MAG: zinc-binding dehydrogenase [Actinobacteria bacterium]|nr:zinc-binding dehydrogenase [Actinomycetota bacterium]NDH95853.1 zinc-binding dehydrogenase [Actinomycetota bacterium]